MKKPSKMMLVLGRLSQVLDEKNKEIKKLKLDNATLRNLIQTKPVYKAHA